MRGEAVDEMIDRARRILADERNQTHLGKWAEALLAEHDARVEAEQEAREQRERALRNEHRVVVAERERDEQKHRTHEWVMASATLHDRANAAEFGVATLEAALRKYGRHLDECAHAWDLKGWYEDSRDCDCGLDAVLGDQVAPTEPCKHCTISGPEDTEAVCVRCGATIILAPQVAPEPERPDAYPGWVLLAKRQTDRDQFILLCTAAAQGGTADDYGAAWDEAHRPAPLVEGEQG